MEARRWTYCGSFRSRAGLSKTEDGTKMRFCCRVRTVPSGSRQETSSQMGCMGGAAVMKRSFTQPWPTPPGLAVARM